jgi:OPA family glycerol-3-phosphate transporter-like MFS transporter
MLTSGNLVNPETERVDRAFRRGQWRILLLVMFCYLFFYTGRQNFGFAARGMQAELGLSSTALGAFNAVLLLGYGLGQAVNGNLSDIFGARRMVAAGAFLSFVLNWCVSLSWSFPLAVVCWGANGYAQSAAWPAMNRALVNWWPKQERGKAIGMYLLAAGFSSSLTFLLCILVIGALDWRWVFRLPVILLLVGGTVFLLYARNRPEDMGFPPLPPDPAEKPASNSRESSLQRYGKVIGNRPFQLACLSIGCESVARYGLLSWVPVHFLGTNWRENTGGLWVTMALPLGMAAGALTAGLAADRWFPERRARVVLYYLGAAAISSALLAAVPTSQTVAGMALLAVTGFLVYGPQASYWALCPNLVGRERAGTATGIMDAVAYGFAALGQIAIGRVIDVSKSTASAFVVIAFACLMGAAIILPVKK